MTAPNRSARPSDKKHEQPDNDIEREAIANEPSLEDLAREGGR